MIKKTIVLAVLSLATVNVFASQNHHAKGALIFNTSEKYPLTIVYQVCGEITCTHKQEVTIPSKAQNAVNYINVSPNLISGVRKVNINIISVSAKDETGKVVVENSALNCNDNFSTAWDNYESINSVITLSDMNSPYVVCQTGGRF